MLLRGWGVGGESCRGEPILKKGGGCCAPVGGVCMSQPLGVDITKNVSMLQRGDTARFEGTDSRTELLPETLVRQRTHGWTETHCNRK